MINKNRALRTLVILFLSLVSFAACKDPGRKEEPANEPSGGKETNLVKTTIRYAHGFRIDYYDHFKLVRVINKLTAGTDTLRYLLVQEGYPVPAGYTGAQIIHIPVKTIIGMSSMHVALADFAGVADRITGLGSLSYISSPVVLNKVKAGKIKQVGIEASMNNELILSMHPGVLIAMSNPEAGFGMYKTLTEAGIPVLLNSEWLETTPLGRAEWVKLMAALVNKEDLVNKKFDSIAQEYNTLAQLGSHAASKPHVIIGIPYKDSWFVPAGESYMGVFLRDAGAGYKWADSKGSGSLALNFEGVSPEALTADYWLNVGYVDSKKDILAKDLRYAEFRSFREDKVYNNNKLTNEQGSNDYWESGGVNPQIVLADMIRILHPELLPEHKLVYYKQLK